jgi:hypothetical protein
MVGPTRSSPNGFGASGSDDLPPPPPMTPSEAFMATTPVGTRTNYSVGPWDYPTCAARHLMAWGARATVEEYSYRKLCMTGSMWRTPRRTRLVLSPQTDL